MALVGDHHRVGVEFPGLLREFFPVAVRREDAGFEAVGVLADDVERLHADRTGRTQYGKSLFHAFVRRRCIPPGPRACRCSRVRIRRVSPRRSRLRRCIRSARPSGWSIPPTRATAKDSCRSKSGSRRVAGPPCSPSPGPRGSARPFRCRWPRCGRRPPPRSSRRNFPV